VACSQLGSWAECPIWRFSRGRPRLEGGVRKRLFGKSRDSGAILLRTFDVYINVEPWAVRCMLRCAPMAALISFYAWLDKQKLLRTPLGNWAKQVVRDAAFPRDVPNLEALLEYVKVSEKGSGQAIAIARLAYRSYERSQRPAPQG